MEAFGFDVCKLKSEWRVSLPHQCDSWDIVNGWNGPEAKTHKEAVELFEAFITEANEALIALKEKREIDFNN